MSLGLASRLARREVRRRPGRTLLVALLVALPTIALGGAAIIVATARSTPTERYRAQYGNADFVVDMSGLSVEGAPGTQRPRCSGQRGRSSVMPRRLPRCRTRALLPACGARP